MNNKKCLNCGEPAKENSNFCSFECNHGYNVRCLRNAGIYHE